MSREKKEKIFLIFLLTFSGGCAKIFRPVEHAFVQPALLEKVPVNEKRYQHDSRSNTIGSGSPVGVPKIESHAKASSSETDKGIDRESPPAQET